MWSDLSFRVRAIFRRRKVEQELDDELRFHFEHEVEKLVATGLPKEEAMRQARLAIGGPDQVKEECREARGTSRVETVFQDLRYAFRGMRRTPAFTLAAVLTLGFGTGAISTVLTLANTLFFRELPVDRPSQIVAVQATRRHGRAPGWVSYPDYVQFRDHTRTLAGLAAHYSTAPLFTTVNNRSREVNGAVVTANYFPLLGLQPALGRFFRPDEDSVPDRDHVAVISHQFWKDWFGSSRDVLDSTLKINGVMFSVIGVTPENFRGVTVSPDEIYMPTMTAGTGYRWCTDAFASDCTVFDMIGRLGEGHTIEEARAEMPTRMPASWATAKEGDNTGVKVIHARGAMHPDITPSAQVRYVTVLSCVAGVLLFVCCINLAGLLIARNSARTGEFAIRTSLGAGRGRLVRQLITESLVLAVCGGAIGMVFSLLLTGALNSMFYSVDVEGHPQYYNFTPEPRVIWGVVLISIFAGLLFSLIPALKTIYGDAGKSLKRQTLAGRQLGRWLAGAQAGVAVALTAVACLLVVSAQTQMEGVNFESSHIALMRLRPMLVKYPPPKAQRFLRAAIERISQIPGVESASMVGNGAVLLGHDRLVSRPGWTETQSLRTGYIEIGPRYFETLGTPVTRGREFDMRDIMQSPRVAIVSEALARQLWPRGDAAGSLVVVDKTPRQVVGIVEDVPLQSRGQPLTPYVFVPFWQTSDHVEARLCIRVKGDPAAMLPLIAREANRVDPDVPIAETITLSTQIAGSIQPLRTTASFVSYAAILALLLSGVGLYGALAFSVSRRTKEIGIRMAIGAKASSVLRQVLKEGMVVVLAGVVIGIWLGVGGVGLVRHLLYGSGSTDAWSYAGAALGVALVGLLACWIPARRAASVEPLVALREQ